jgi:hypothetical protein
MRFGIQLLPFDSYGVMRCMRILFLVQCLFHILSVIQVSAIDLRRGPYLMGKNATSITIKWRTDPEVRERSAIWYGERLDRLEKTAVAYEPHHHYPGVREWEVTLADLKPGTLYYYAIELDHAIIAGADERHFFKTDPLKTENQVLRFWFLGDSGSNRPRWDVKEPPFGEGQLSHPIQVRNGFRTFNRGQSLDGIILLGDNAYPFGTDRQYQAAFFNVYRDELAHTPLFPCVGNHDMDDAYPYVFRLGSTNVDHGTGSKHPYYYSRDLGDMHLVVLDPWKLWLEQTTDVTLPDWKKQLDWLKQDLSRNNQKWTVLVNHFPLYCAGNYDSDTNEPLKLLREMLVPIIDQYGLDLVIAGHDHTYQRSYLLKGLSGGRETFDPGRHRFHSGDFRPTVIRKNHGSHSGAIYVISGTAGGSRTENPFNHPVMVPFTNEKNAPRGLETPGSFLLEIRNATLHGRQIDQAGRTLDEFRIIKGD